MQLFNRKHYGISTIHVRTKEVGETCSNDVFGAFDKSLNCLVDFITMTNGLAINKELKRKRSYS